MKNACKAKTAEARLLYTVGQLHGEGAGAGMNELAMDDTAGAEK
jgi:hypothetical protein